MKLLLTDYNTGYPITPRPASMTSDRPGNEAAIADTWGQAIPSEPRKTSKSSKVDYYKLIRRYTMSLKRGTFIALEACPKATPGPSRLPALIGPRCFRSGHGVASRVIRRRWNATTAAPSPSSIAATPIHKEPAFDALSTALSASQPCFGARGDEISLLTSPEEFRRTLLEMIKRAKRRILISSLYIGASQGEIVCHDTMF